MPTELRTVDAGSLWTPVAVPHAVSLLGVVQCTGTLCLAAGNGDVLLRSTDDGLTWQVEALPSSMAGVTTLACPSSTICFAEGAATGDAGGGAIVGSTDAGATWTGQYDESTSYLQSLWCASATSCYAYGTTYLATTDGTTWAPVAVPDDFPTIAVCPSATTCVGSSPSAGLVTSSDGGSTWTISDGFVVPTSLSCGSATTCVGTDGPNLVITTDGGASWSEQTPPFTSALVLGVSCLSATSCQAVGTASADTYPDRALLLDVAPSSEDLTPERVATALDAAVSASCPSSTACAVAAVDPYGNPMLVATTSGGASWRDVEVPGRLAVEDQVLCVTASSCLVTGSDTDGQGSVWRTTNEATWASGAVPSSVGEVTSLTCRTPASCLATAYLVNSFAAVLSTSNGGRTWAQVAMPHTVTDLTGVVCTTAADCIAVGGRGEAVGLGFYSDDGGRRWRTARLTGGLRSLNGVSCTSAADCLAGSSVRRGAITHGVVARTVDAGAIWSPVAAPGSTAVVISISCWSPSSCEAVGQTTAAYEPDATSAAIALATTTAGRSWTTQALPKEQWTLTSVACARTGACMAAGVGDFLPPGLPTGASILRLP